MNHAARRVTRPVSLVCALTVSVLAGTASPALAGGPPTTAHVEVGPGGDPVFSPKNAHARIGDTVEWDWASSGHSSTDSSGLGLWDSGVLSQGDTFSRVFTAAGKYHYVSTPDAGAGMTGVVRVPMQVNPKSGVAGITNFRFTWGDAAPPAGVYFEVQCLEGSAGKFRDCFGSPGLGETFRTTLGSGGTWHFRARLLNTVSGAHTNWSPIATVAVT